MSTATHTPGPWHAQERSQCFAIVPECGPEITFLYQHGSVTAGGRTYEEIGANARLIAAAPELLAALRDAEACIYHLAGSDDLPGYASGVVVNARAALAKAEGNV